MFFGTVKSGEVAGATSATRMPTISCRYVCFKAASDNAGRVWIGGAGVTAKDGTTDATTGFPLAASEVTPVFPVGNLNEFYYICDNAGDDVIYIALD